MRGSSVLLGAADGAFRCEQTDGLVTLHCEKLKEGEAPPPLHLRLETVRWNDGDADSAGEDHTTLVPIQAEMPGGKSLSMDQIRQAFGLLTDAWSQGKPLSNKYQSKREGRFAPRILARQLGGDAEVWESQIELWLENGNLDFEMYDKKSKKTGLRVIDAIT
jgi:hypothetical protein